MKTAQKFCEAMTKLVDASLEENNRVANSFPHTKRKDKAAGRLYMDFQDGSHCYFDVSTGKLTLPKEFHNVN